MASNATLELIVQMKGDAAKQMRDLGGATEDAGRKGGILSTALGVATGGAILSGVSALTGAVSGIFTDGIEQSNQWSAAMAQTDAVIASTGGHAGVTRAQVEGLANSLSANGGLSTFADDAVASGENLLLTFTNIGSDVFPDATQAMLDMSAALGQDMKSSAIQLGKALNDPRKGITALSRVGVTFTQEQKAMINQMLLAGNTMGAQKVILAELGKEFGGSALAGTQTLAGQQAIMAEQFNNVKQTIGDALIPVLAQLGAIISSPAVMGAIQGLASGFASLISGVGTQLPGIFDAIGRSVAFFMNLFSSDEVLGPEEFFDNLPGPINAVLNALMPLVQFARDVATSFVVFFQGLADGRDPMENIMALLGNLGELIMGLGEQVLQAVGDALPGILAKLGEWGLAFLNWVLPLIPPLLEKLGQLAGQLLDWLVNTALPNIVTNLLKWGKAFVDWVGPQIPPLLEKLGQLAGQVIGWMVNTALPAILGKLLEWGVAFVTWVAPLIPPLLLELAKILLAIGTWIVTEALPAIIGKLVEWGGAFVGWIGKDVLPLLPGALNTLWTALTTWISNAASNIVGKVKEIGTNLIDGIKQGAQEAWDNFTRWLGGLIDGLPQWVKDILGMHSPSVRFAEIGYNIPAGIALGVRKGLPLIDAAFDDMMGKLLPPTLGGGGFGIQPVLAGGSLSGGFGIQPVAAGGWGSIAGGGVGGTAINIVVNTGAGVNGDEIAQKVAAKVSQAMGLRDRKRHAGAQ